MYLSMEKIILEVCEKIVELVSPRQIFLFSQKSTLDGGISAFKICVVSEGNPAEIEGKIYLAIECSVSFDVLVYSAEDWDRLSPINSSFASHILKCGSVVYVQTT